MTYKEMPKEMLSQIQDLIITIKWVVVLITLSIIVNFGLGGLILFQLRTPPNDVFKKTLEIQTNAKEIQENLADLQQLVSADRWTYSMMKLWVEEVNKSIKSHGITLPGLPPQVRALSDEKSDN